MSIAYHVMAHKDPQQVLRLVRRLATPEALIVLHYDARCPRREHQLLRRSLSALTNVIFQEPTAVLWGRYSLFHAQFEGLRMALSSGKTWTHWLNLSGQCYPLVSQDELQKRVHNLGEKSLVRHFDPLNGGDWHQPTSRLEYHYLDYPRLEKIIRMPKLGRLLRTYLFGGGQIPRALGIKYPIPTQFKWYGGDNWVILSRAAGNYIVSSPESEAIRKILRHSAFPEESLFQTILLNSPLKDRIENRHMRKIKWIGGSASPGVYCRSDLAELQESGAHNCIIARKFEAGDSADLLDLLDAQNL